jgi:hypothetical protein
VGDGLRSDTEAVSTPDCDIRPSYHWIRHVLLPDAMRRQDHEDVMAQRYSILRPTFSDRGGCEHRNYGRDSDKLRFNVYKTP